MYDELPREMRRYLSHHGWNFSKRACEQAIKEMRRLNTATGKKEAVEPINKEQAEEFLAKYNVKIENNSGYNFVYVLNMAKTDYYKSSIPNEECLAKFVKDYIDDPDNEGGNVFRKYYVDKVAKGEPIEWDDII